MKKLNVVLLGILLLATLIISTAEASDVSMSLSKKDDNSLVISYVVDELASTSVSVSYNVYYSGDNYPKTSLFEQDAMFGATPDMSGKIVIDEDFVKETWIPRIQQYVVNPKIWVEYVGNDGKTVKSNSITP